MRITFDENFAAFPRAEMSGLAVQIATHSADEGCSQRQGSVKH